VTTAGHDTQATSTPGVTDGIGASEVTGVWFSAIGTTVVLVVTDPAATAAAEAMLRADLAELDQACSRFRADSEIRELERVAGCPVRVSPLLAEVVDTAARRPAHRRDGRSDRRGRNGLPGL
jgi:thiamine biosynthesis lipoprotein ApbE